MSNDKTIDATRQAVRHLIVGDTQFAWNGSTTLKLQEMMDLQERGWISEGEDNLEFNLTEAGEEVVARALEHGAPATLATVKHGGCVQLGTPGSRWAASGEPDPHGTRYDCERAALVMGDLTDDELANVVFMHGNERKTMAELVGGATPAIAYLTAAKDRIRWLSRALAAAEALSAQPSPGSQGDALELLEAYDQAVEDLSAERSGGCNEDNRRPQLEADVSELRTELIAALAARQPVGEPVGYLDLGVGGYMDVGTDLSNEELEALPKGRHMLGIIGTYGVDGYRPAQAVDLGQFREAVVYQRSTFMAYGPYTNNPEYSRVINKCDHLLALIDSQAVGK